MVFMGIIIHLKLGGAPAPKPIGVRKQPSLRHSELRHHWKSLWEKMSETPTLVVAASR